MGTWGTAIFSDDLAPKNLIHYLKNALHTTHPIFRLANTAIGVLFDDHEKQVIPKNICYPYNSVYQLYDFHCQLCTVANRP